MTVRRWSGAQKPLNIASAATEIGFQRVTGASTTSAAVRKASTAVGRPQ
ncbi:MAG: hypothetical protein BWX79_03324 [Alphaproteobacteria bacterium ADurb.Bin100]|jgi:hypothetical protein|nr:MAG: hypothetical protein BWX79_03324 [Alphaproteobacteria bacterium ADurb.Bin100]